MRNSEEVDTNARKVISIAVRPAKKAPLKLLMGAELDTENGLNGDHYSGRSGKRHLTLISQGEIDQTADLLNKEKIDPLLTRRNLLYSGPTITDNEKRIIGIGDSCLIEITGPCDPCHQMDKNFGEGAEKAMQGRAGLTARVLRKGKIKPGDELFFIEE